MFETGKLSLVWSATAREDLIRQRDFIQPHNPLAAKRASEKNTQGCKTDT